MPQGDCQHVSGCCSGFAVSSWLEQAACAPSLEQQQEQGTRDRIQVETVARVPAQFVPASDSPKVRLVHSELMPAAAPAVAASPYLELPRRATAEPVPMTAVLSQYEPMIHTPGVDGEEPPLSRHEEEEYSEVDYYDRHRRLDDESDVSALNEHTMDEPAVLSQSGVATVTLSSIGAVGRAGQQAAAAGRLSTLVALC